MRMQTHMQINRQMAILATIRKLQFATRRHLMSIHEMGGIRNANRIMKDLSIYTSKVVYNKEHVYYLNQSGHKLFGEGKLYIMVKLHTPFT